MMWIEPISEARVGQQQDQLYVPVPLLLQQHQLSAYQVEAFGAAAVEPPGAPLHGAANGRLRALDQLTIVGRFSGRQLSVPGEAECLDCGKIFEADLEKLVCPACESLKLRPISGRDMTITEIEGY